MQLNDVRRYTVLIVEKIKKSHARDPYGNICSLEGQPRCELSIEGGPRAGDPRCKRAAITHAVWRWYLCDHRPSLFVLENEVIVRIFAGTAFKLVICKRRIYYEYSCLGRAYPAVVLNRVRR